MPRTARIYIEEGIFHVLARGNNKQNIFLDQADFASYKSLFQRIRADHPFKLYHYCLMNNHIHLIIETNPESNLSRFMKRINLAYYNYFNKKYGYSGRFWQDRFKSLVISKDEYLTACGLYIERNPVKAKIVESPRLYKYSSYNYYAYGHKDDIMDIDPIYGGLASTDSKRQEAYRNLASDERLGINEFSFKQLFLGNEDFIETMEKRFGFRNVRLNRGRPRNK
jgi:putative transposase